MERRRFLKTLAVVGASAATAPVAASDEGPEPMELYGVLVDTTRCAGCRGCEKICAETHGLPVPDTLDETVFDGPRESSESQWTVVNRFDTDAGEIFVKQQCMHCNQPACASACLTKAMLKTPEGPVTYRKSKCMGCRFCMISCPFDVPKFEYHSATPRIRKCVMCTDRVLAGQPPACVENCPAEALTFGKRSELIEEARRRIYADPESYYPAIYGEHDVGGTAWLYLASVPFEQLGFRTDLGTTAYPELTRGFLYGVPIVLTLWPAFLLALSQATRREEQAGVLQEAHS